MFAGSSLSYIVVKITVVTEKGVSKTKKKSIPRKQQNVLSKLPMNIIF